MNICFLSRILFLSGVTTHMRDLAAELIKQGHKVTICTAGKQFENHVGMGKLYNSLLQVGVEIQHIPYPNNNSRGLRKIYDLLLGFFYTMLFLHRQKFDVIHVHTPILSFIPKILGKKFVTTIHVADLHLGILHCNATEEIAISKAVWNDCLKRGVPKEHINLIYNGVDSRYAGNVNRDIIQATKKKLGISENELVIGFVGTLCYRKGVDLLLKSCKELIGKESFHCVLLGNFDNEVEREKIVNLIKTLDMDTYVTIVAYDDPFLYYKTFDIFVLPSRLEGFPLVPIEAMLSGCCVIRSNTEGAYEQIDSGVNGFIFENENIGQLTDVLKTLIQDPALMHKVAKAGKEKALKEFTSEVMAKKTLEVYKKVIYGK